MNYPKLQENNLKPSANTGAHAEVRSGIQVTQNGTESESDNGALCYSWKQTASPYTALKNTLNLFFLATSLRKGKF